MKENKNKMEEPVKDYRIIKTTEEKRLRRDIFRSDDEKFRLFVNMLKRNALFNKATVTHKVITPKI